VTLSPPPTTPAVIRLQYTYQVGDPIPPLRSSRDRSGYAILRGDDEADINAAWNSLSLALHVDTIPPSPDEHQL
jgi:L-amino acid ligase C-terminal domain 2